MDNIYYKEGVSLLKTCLYISLLFWLPITDAINKEKVSSNLTVHFTFKLVNIYWNYK